MRTIVIIGGGNIGSRHLQAVAKLEEPAKVYLVEPSKDSVKVALDRFNEINGAEKHELKIHSDVSDLPEELDVVIIATNSAVRRAVIDELIKHSCIRYLILEKFLFQTEEDFDYVDELFKKYGIVAYTDCTRREMDCYIELKEMLKDAKFIDMSVSGGDWGIGCNGIHMLDLHSFLTGDNEYESDELLLDNKIYDSKRKGYIEFCGRISFRGGKGFLSLTSFYNNNSPLTITIQSDVATVIIYEYKNEMLVVCSDENGDTITRKRRIDITPTSEVTTRVINELNSTGRCNLPRYEENALLERIILKAFLNKMDVVTNINNTICNIT